MIETDTSQFKARLGQFMRTVREGKEIIIKDRDEPVARLLPYGAAFHEERLLKLRKSPSAPPAPAPRSCCRLAGTGGDFVLDYGHSAPRTS